MGDLASMAVRREGREAAVDERFADKVQMLAGSATTCIPNLCASLRTQEEDGRLLLERGAVHPPARTSCSSALDVSLRCSATTRGQNSSGCSPIGPFSAFSALPTSRSATHAPRVYRELTLSRSPGSRRWSGSTGIVLLEATELTARVVVAFF